MKALIAQANAEAASSPICNSFWSLEIVKCILKKLGFRVGPVLTIPSVAVGWAAHCISDIGWIFSEISLFRKNGVKTFRRLRSSAHPGCARPANPCHGYCLVLRGLSRELTHTVAAAASRDTSARFAFNINVISW
jgi:hypothetical protein